MRRVQRHRHHRPAGGPLLVRREPDPSDRRVKNVVATDEGRDVIRRVREEMQATSGALDTLDAAESTTLYELLARLRPGMEKNA